MMFIKKEDIEWKIVKYLKEPLGASPEHATWKYEMWLNEPLASWDVFDYWEKERIASMEKHLKKGDVLFDIGSEQGWCNLVYAEIVGPENMVLIEPTAEFWPNIKALWEKNFDVAPLCTLHALVSDKTARKPLNPEYYGRQGRYPDSSNNDLIDRNKYTYIHDNNEKVPEIKLDDFVEISGIVPDALTMDTEGFEHLILKGAEYTLKKYKPKLFISLHDDLALEHIGVDIKDTIEYLTSLGYVGEHLATDHEAHWYFYYVG